jgi:hypothetical protein
MKKTISDDARLGIIGDGAIRSVMPDRGAPPDTCLHSGDTARLA